MNKRIRKKRVRQMLLAELSFQFEHTDDAITWLDTPLAGLENRTPREAVSAGEWERVTLILHQMNSAKAGHQH